MGDAPCDRSRYFGGRQGLAFKHRLKQETGQKYAPGPRSDAALSLFTSIREFAFPNTQLPLLGASRKLRSVRSAPVADNVNSGLAV